MTLTAEKLPFGGDEAERIATKAEPLIAAFVPPFSGDAIQSLMATVDRVVPFVHKTCQMEYGYSMYFNHKPYVCGRKAVKTCTVCEVTQCDRCDCGCER